MEHDFLKCAETLPFLTLSLPLWCG